MVSSCAIFDTAADYETWSARYRDHAARLPTVRTRRGYHVYLLDADGITESIDLRSFGIDGELKGDRTYIVAPGSVVAFDRAGKPIVEFKYRWLNDPPDLIPTVSLAGTGLLPDQAIHELKERQNGKWHTGHVGTQGPVGQPGPKGSPRKGGWIKHLQVDVESLVCGHSIDGPGKRRNALKSLAMEILAIGGADNRPPLADRLTIFDAWWSRFGRFATTKDPDYSFEEFDRMIDELRGGGFQFEVTTMLEEVEIPSWAAGSTETREAIGKLIIACDQISEGKPFFLSGRGACRMAFGNLNQHSTVARTLSTFVRKGVLKKVSTGENRPGGKANTYQLLLDAQGNQKPATPADDPSPN